MSNINNIFKHNPDFKNENKIKFERVIYDDDDKQLKRLINALTHKNKSLFDRNYVQYSSNSGHPGYQRVVFKMHYSSTKTSHMNYIKKYMPQNDKEEVIEKPKLFGTDYDEYIDNMVEKNFKLIISPENQNVDLNLLVKDFIKKTEFLTGYKFYWQAAIHEDTNHRHVHLCINGIDQNGKDVWLKKQWIKKDFRNLLSYGCTLLVGQRTAREISVAKQNLITSTRYTELDKTLNEYDTDIFTLKKLPVNLQNRILYLADLNLAEKVEKGKYRLLPKWDETLLITGRYNTYINEFINDRTISLYEGGNVKGTVLKVISFDKDEAWNDAIILQTQDGKKLYIPVYELQKENLVGEDVYIKGGTKAMSLQIKDKDILIQKKKPEAPKQQDKKNTKDIEKEI